MQRSKEEQITLKRFQDLCRMAYQRGIPFFSDFAGLSEKDLAYQAVAEQYPDLSLDQYPFAYYGGYPDAERTVLCFLPEIGFPVPEPEQYPICCIRIAPLNRRFSEVLTHRDYLGTLMGLGIERDQIGDIVVRKEGSTGAEMIVAYVFCKQNKAELLLDLKRVRHTTVTAKKINAQTLHWTPEYKEIRGSVSSLRLDTVLSVAIRTSRTQGLQLIQDGNIYINGRCCTENAKSIQDGDVLSIRGHGKYLFCNTGTISKKGRYQIIVKQYI